MMPLFRPKPIGKDGFTLLQVLVVAAVLGVTSVFLSETIRYIARQSAGARLNIARDYLVYVKMRNLATSPAVINQSVASGGATNAMLGRCITNDPPVPPNPACTQGEYELRLFMAQPFDVNGVVSARTPIQISEIRGTAGTYYTSLGEICPTAIVTNSTSGGPGATSAKLYCPFEVHTFVRIQGGDAVQAEYLEVHWIVSLRTDYDATSDRVGRLGSIERSDNVYVRFITGEWYVNLFEALLPIPFLGHGESQGRFL